MQEDNDTHPERHARRGFLASLGALIIGGLAGLAPVFAAVVNALHPLRKSSGHDPLVRVTSVAVLPSDGAPRKFTIRSDRVDAWTTYADEPIGAVYLRWDGDEVLAFNVVCPHAGCFIGLAPDASRFECPCHKSTFKLDGTIDDPDSPSPRGMDALDVEVREGDEVWVRFRSFLPGRPEKTPLV